MTGRTAHRSDHEPRRKKEDVAANGTPNMDEGGDFISQTKVEIDNEPLQLADRHFELVIFRPQKGTAVKSTYWGGDYPIQAAFAKNTNTVIAARVAAREEAAIGKHRQRTALTDENKQYNPAGRVMIR